MGSLNDRAGANMANPGAGADGPADVGLMPRSSGLRDAASSESVGGRYPSRVPPPDVADNLARMASLDDRARANMVNPGAEADGPAEVEFIIRSSSVDHDAVPPAPQAEMVSCDAVGSAELQRSVSPGEIIEEPSSTARDGAGQSHHNATSGAQQSKPAALEYFLTHSPPTEMPPRFPEPPPEDIYDIPPLPETNDADMAMHALETINLDEFLATDNGGRINEVFIGFPPVIPWELTLVLNYFKRLGCRVYCSRNITDWERFRKSHRHGLIVVHPDDCFLGTFPHLGSLLFINRARVCTLGVQKVRCHLQGIPPVYDAMEIFPRVGGNFYYLTDELFIYYPDKAAAIIQDFNRKARQKPKGWELSKIGARPGIRGWLKDLMLRKAGETSPQSRTAQPYVDQWTAICELCPFDEYESLALSHGRLRPRPDALLWCMHEDDLLPFVGVWERDELRATEIMVEVFADQANSLKHRYRSFVVVYQRPERGDDKPPIEGVRKTMDKRGWLRRYTNLTLIGPEAMLKHQLAQP